MGPWRGTMANKDSSDISSRSARERLRKRAAPYWFVMERGRTLGYLKGVKGGSWLARFYDPLADPPRRQTRLGSADDVSDADGKMVLSFSQAKKAAEDWFKEAYYLATGDRVQTGDYLVLHAVEDYLDDRERHGAKTAQRMRWDFNARVLPALGKVPVAKLTKKRLEDWLKTQAESPATYRGKEQPPPKTEDEIRARQESTNRLWSNLKAALNLAFEQQHVATDAGWRKVKEFRGTTVPRVRFLSVVEQKRLVNAAPTADFRRLLQGGLFTGCRESELIRLRVMDFDGANGSIFIAKSKNGKARHLTLTGEATAFFTGLVAGLTSEEPIFPRTEYRRRDKRNTGTWNRAELFRKMKEVCTAAKIEPMVFHELRHTYASVLVNAGVPLSFVAEQLGHRNTRQVEKHYGHLCPNARTDTIRKLTPLLGIAEPGNVIALATPGAS